MCVCWWSSVEFSRINSHQFILDCSTYVKNLFAVVNRIIQNNQRLYLDCTRLAHTRLVTLAALVALAHCAHTEIKSNPQPSTRLAHTRLAHTRLVALTNKSNPLPSEQMLRASINNVHFYSVLPDHDRLLLPARPAIPDDPRWNHAIPGSLWSTHDIWTHSRLDEQLLLTAWLALGDARSISHHDLIARQQAADAYYQKKTWSESDCRYHQDGICSCEACLYEASTNAFNLSLPLSIDPMWFCNIE